MMIILSNKFSHQLSFILMKLARKDSNKVRNKNTMSKKLKYKSKNK